MTSNIVTHYVVLTDRAGDCGHRHRTIVAADRCSRRLTKTDGNAGRILAGVRRDGSLEPLVVDAARTQMVKGARKVVTSATLSPAAIAAVKARSAGETGRYAIHSDSGVLDRMATRYAAVCERHRPVLSRAEAMLICDALNGTWLSDAGSVAWIAAEIEDAIRLNGLDQKWKVDGPDLLRRAATWSYAERLAVVDLVERFWAAEGRGENGEDQLPEPPAGDGGEGDARG